MVKDKTADEPPASYRLIRHARSGRPLIIDGRYRVTAHVLDGGQVRIEVERIDEPPLEVRRG